MIVYGHYTFRLNISGFLREFESRLDTSGSVPAHDTMSGWLVDLGEAHAAVADALCPAQDDYSEPLHRWDAATRSLADAFVASWRDESDVVRSSLARCRTAVDELARCTSPAEVAARTAEGFALWSLFPEQYALAAERFVHARRPAAVTCIGIRSIGVPLAHVAAAAMARAGISVHVISVRPRGDPFDRTLSLSHRLSQFLTERRADTFAIVDEGPGLSGSSFAAASDALRALGIADDRIVLFPSWCPPPDALRSDRGRSALTRHAVWLARFEDVYPMEGLTDMSAGAWRPFAFAHEDAWPAVHPQHERRKYLLPTRRRATREPRSRRVWAARDASRDIEPSSDRQSGSGQPEIARFAGLGRYGRTKLERAVLLAAAGVAPEPGALEHGFLTEQWVDGTRLTAGSIDDRAIESIARYLALIGSRFQTGSRARVADLIEMIGVNVSIDVSADFDEPEVAVDGRMLPHEWIQAAGRLIKTDALDHHADDFLPRARDIAWDVAGTIVEFDMDDAAARRLTSRYKQHTGDRSIEQRLDFYTTAYLSYRIGYAVMAAESLGDSSDGRRFRVLQERYRRSLAAHEAHRRRGRRS